MPTTTTTTIVLDDTRSFAIRRADDGWAAVLVTTDKADYVVRIYPSYQEARDAAHKWAQAELAQTARLRQWRREP